MRFDLLLARLLDDVAQEHLALRRTTRYILPLLLLPIGFALAQMARGWLGLITGGVAALVLLAQIELFVRPTVARARVAGRDMSLFLGLPPSRAPRDTRQLLALLAPAALALTASMAIAFPTMLARAEPWQRLLALALGIGALLAIGQRLAQVHALLGSIERRLRAADEQPAPSGARPSDGLLDPAIARRMAGLTFPVLALAPAAQALLRAEAYLALRDFPATSDAELQAALADLAWQAHADELRHWLLPPVGGKIYLPIAANGVLARLLGDTARRLGMDGAFSATLGTWLIRLPPARSYAVAGRLIDALIAIGLAPPGSILPHHLTVQGDLGGEARVLSIVHLIATPLLFEERPGPAQADERPFIMRGGGVLDDMAGRGRQSGPRTDFVDGFIFAQAPGLDGVEHLTAHTINLRVKQVLAFGLQASRRPAERRSPAEQRAADAYIQLRASLRDLLTRYGLAGMLEVDWIDGRWSEIWPLILRMSELKERDTAFLREAQQLRDRALDAIEGAAAQAS